MLWPGQFSGGLGCGVVVVAEGGGGMDVEGRGNLRAWCIGSLVLGGAGGGARGAICLGWKGWRWAAKWESGVV